MPLYRITVRQLKVSGGQRIEPGMTADVVTDTISNPLTETTGRRRVNDAFLRLYGIDLDRLGTLNQIYLTVERKG